MSRDQRLMRRIHEAVLGAQLAAARSVAGLFVEPETAAGDPNPVYNDDAQMPWKLASTRTRAALILTQGAMAAERAQRQGPAAQVFGMVLMQPRVEAHEEWERMAAAPAPKVIEATAAAASEETKGGSDG